ncbi:MAG: enoyl-CoA hydratase-related protein [Pseudomonadota bacterium]
MEFVTTETDGNILKVTLNRPEVYNAMHPPMHHELSGVWDSFEADQDLWIAVLTGAGDKAFSAGNDLKYTASGGTMEPPETGFGGLANRLDRTKPIIAAVNGFAMGGGMETAMACDIILAAETATFALPEVKVGFIAGAGGIQRLSRQIGRKAAMEILLTGRKIGAPEAVTLGIANAAVPADGLMDAALAKAREITANSPSSVKATMRVLAMMDEQDDTLTGLHFSRTVLGDLRKTYDFSEGVNAFVEKRKPAWKNR